MTGVVHQRKVIYRDVWHHRMCHPSSHILDLLSILVVSKDNSLKNKFY